MANSIFTVAIIGVGGRGGYAYGTLIADMPDKFKITALCDVNTEKLGYFSEKFGVTKEDLYTDEADFFKEKRADVLIISTQDKDHVRHAKIAFSLGYDILLEKPITDKKEELEELLALQKQNGCKALVCHVLRYAPAYMKIAELIESGAIGKLVAINAIEQVGYLHQAQSFVRGNWRRECDSVPMILAKCSHDLDLIQFYANSTCDTLSSVGELSHFVKDNAPDGAADRCLECQHVEACPYSAKTEYIDKWQKVQQDVYPFNVPCNAPVTEEKMRTALENGPYGRCVYKCDNDVVDHQVVNMLFENGTTAHLTMTAFSDKCYREIHLHGEKGEIFGNMMDNVLHCRIFGGESYDIDLNEQINAVSGYHGGGDYHLLRSILSYYNGEQDPNVTTLAVSMQSHYIGFAAERSRHTGETIKL